MDSLWKKLSSILLSTYYGTFSYALCLILKLGFGNSNRVPRGGFKGEDRAPSLPPEALREGLGGALFTSIIAKIA